MTEVDRLAAEVREQNQLHEAGKTDVAFWLGQQNRLKAMRAADSKLTQTAIGVMVGKGQKWVATVLAWDYSRGNSPFADADNPSKQGNAPARAALQDPARRKQVLETLTNEDKVALAGDLMAAPSVVDQVVAQSPTAAKAVRKAAEDAEEVAARKRVTDAKNASAARNARPLSQYFWSMIGKVHEWSRDLKSIEEDLATLPEAQKPKVAAEYRRLRDVCNVGLNILEDDHAVGENVIDGTARDSRGLALAQ